MAAMAATAAAVETAQVVDGGPHTVKRVAAGIAVDNLAEALLVAQVVAPAAVAATRRHSATMRARGNRQSIQGTA